MYIEIRKVTFVRTVHNLSLSNLSLVVPTAIHVRPAQIQFKLQTESGTRSLAVLINTFNYDVHTDPK